MHLRAAGIHRVLSVYRTVLLLCVIHLLVNSCVRSYPTETGGNRDSDRLEKLRWIAKRLTHLRQDPLVDMETRTAETLAFKRSLNASMGTAHKTADTATKTGDPSHIRKSNRRKTRRRGPKRVHRQTSTPIEKFSQALTNLHDVMVPFLKTLRMVFKGHSSVLNNVIRIPEVLQLSDRVFSQNDVWTIVRRFMLLEKLLRKVLDNSSKFVKKRFKPWFKTDSSNVESALNALSTLALPLHKASSNVKGEISLLRQAHFTTGFYKEIYDLIHFLDVTSG